MEGCEQCQQSSLEREADEREEYRWAVHRLRHRVQSQILEYRRDMVSRWLAAEEPRFIPEGMAASLRVVQGLIYFVDELTKLEQW